MFTEKEIAYIRSQSLGRLATVDEKGQPDNVAISKLVLMLGNPSPPLEPLTLSGWWPPTWPAPW